MNISRTHNAEFEELFKTNYSRYFYFALDWVEDEETAKDIVSDVFGDVWADYDHLRNENILAYMLRAVRNRSINYLKHQRIAKDYQDKMIKAKESAFVDNLDTQDENLMIIEQTIKTLSPKTRTIFEQCYIYGKKYKEQADEMNISVSAINKHMTQAFTAFKSAFAKKSEKTRSGVFFFLFDLLL